MDKVVKRDGSVVDFDPQKVYGAIEKALKATGEKVSFAKEIGDKVIQTLKAKYGDLKPSVEDIQDIVEKQLIEQGKLETAKAYILYRQERSAVRQRKEILGIKDSLKLSLNSLRVLEERYLRRDSGTGIAETPADMFRRVARAIAEVESNYGGKPGDIEGEFYRIMANLEFLPNSPALMNAGTELGQLSACFVLPVEDSLVSIFDALKHAALIHQSGGGTGFSFSRVRPSGDVVKSTLGVASGPISFMRIFDRATEIIKQGGKRRGANIGILRIDHPDILDFIRAKEHEGELSNFNISVAVTDDFMDTMNKNQGYEIINPRTHKATEVLKAHDVFELIAINAWKSGDPGILYIDEINRKNPLPGLGTIEATNPCGEVPLIPYESCNLGSVNLVQMFTNGKFDFTKLSSTVKLGVRFLDNMIDVNNYPLEIIEKNTKANRKIGLGVMGFADCLIKSSIPYNSQQALDFAEEIMNFIQNEARAESRLLGETRGSFAHIGKSIFKDTGPLRNATVTSIAPTGSISTIAGVSSGIEPLFSVGYLRNALDTTLLVVNPMFEDMARAQGFYSADLIAQVVREGTIQKNARIPPAVRRLFPTAHDISPEFHVKMQAAFQKYVDNAVSKTINLPREATLEHTRSVFIFAHQLKCKGLTIYRYGSKKKQALEFGEMDTPDACVSGVC
jgi:ribonucleoside-diphosphate reductase alpha chain